MTDDIEALEERRNELENEYAGAAKLAGWRRLRTAATDFRHALGMDTPANSLNKEVMARTLAIVRAGELGTHGLISAENTAKELRASLVEEVALVDEEPTSLGPVIFDLMTAVEAASDTENVAKLAVENTPEEDDFEESYLGKRYDAVEDSDDD